MTTVGFIIIILFYFPRILGALSPPPYHTPKQPREPEFDFVYDINNNILNVFGEALIGESPHTPRPAIIVLIIIVLSGINVNVNGVLCFIYEFEFTGDLVSPDTVFYEIILNENEYVLKEKGNVNRNDIEKGGLSPPRAVAIPHHINFDNCFADATLLPVADQHMNHCLNYHENYHENELNLIYIILYLVNHHLNLILFMI